ncbi:MAG: glycosyltransferase family 2 protein [Clostridiales bacterium]|nr:glycosyltransferase family 2 protein [Clostridiales bacterium]
MKLISFAVPCYNSQEYMRKCIESILTGGEDVEIIIVNDGSKDNTLQIAQEYVEKYPTIVKVIDKENGGHGSGVNAGMHTATGLYYKVVDSDDWVDEDALRTLIDTIKQHLSAEQLPDLYITNFIYDRVVTNEQYVSDYVKMMPQGQIIGWDKVKKFRLSHMLLMHSLMYKREKLLASGTVLPEHTFYVDELYAYKPLPYMETICYLNLNLYHYFIGRADQSVTKSNMLARYKQQLRVMREMIDSYTWDEIRKMPKGLRRYMWHSLAVIMVLATFYTCAEWSDERKQAINELWQHLKERDIKLYRRLRHRSYVTFVNCMGWRMRKFVLNKGYDILCKEIKLG